MDKSDLIQNLKISLDAIYEISAKQEEVNVAQENINAINSKAEEIVHISIMKILAPIAWIFLFYKLSFVIEDSKAAFFGGVAISTLVIFAFCKYRKWKRQQKAAEYRESNLPSAIAILNRKNSELKTVCESKKVALMCKTIPMDYATVDAVSFLIMALNNQRADSLKEALNLYEDERHKREMLDTQQRELELLAESVALGQAQLSSQEKALAGQAAILRQTNKLSKQVRFSNAMGIINTVKHWKN